MQLPLISIAMCTYNGAKYIKQQIDSILTQSYTNIELVIVDDCSTDDTVEIVKTYATKDSRVKYYSNQVNLGFNKNFEKAVSHTTGNYIAISDQDDIWLPNKIEELFTAIGDNWLVFSNSEYMDESGKTNGVYLIGQPYGKNITFKSILFGNFVTGHTTLFTREFLTYVLPFPPVGFYDWWMGFVALYHNKLIYLNKALTQYRVHQQSVIQQSLQIDENALRRLHTKIAQDMLAHFVEYKWLNDLDKSFIANLQACFRQVKYPFFNTRLISLINKNYAELFPLVKKRVGLSKFNYALRYARGIKE